MTKKEIARDDLSMTIASYDQIAGEYHARWQDRSPIENLARRFIEMIKVYGLTGELIVDVGCGPGFDTAIFRQHGLWAIGLDLSHQMINVGQDHYPGQFVLADMRYLPFAQKVGGLWVAASMLHVAHGDVLATLINFARALVPGGLLYLSLKLGQDEEWSTGPYDTPRYFAYHQPEELNQLLRAAGFHIVEGWQSEVAHNQTQWLIRFARRAPAHELKTLDLLK